MATAIHQPRPESELVASFKTAHPGMGAMPHTAGVAFRVWAPNASHCSVIGEFNAWSSDSNPMVREANGCWYVDIRNARIGDEYRYFIRNGESEFTRIDPYARQVTNSVGNAMVQDPFFDWGDDNFVMPPWNELVIYEMHIGTYNDEPGGEPGTFADAEKRLAHLKELGINAIELMPAAEFAGDFSWGYNPAHVYAIESAYGGPRAFKHFVRQAHRLGIAVILDVVYNHFGPSDLALWQFDGWSQNGLGGIYFYNDWRSETPWGNTRPDYGRPEVRQFIHDNALMWVEDYHIDGLRYDMTLYMRSVRGNGDSGCDLPDGWGLAQWINRSLRERFPGRITIAEDLQNNDWLTKSPQHGGAGFGTQWDAAFVHPIRAAVCASDDSHRHMWAVRNAICAKYNSDAFQRVVYTESHDEVANGKARVPSEIDPSGSRNWYARKRSTLAAGVIMTSPGIPMLFQGQEFCQHGWFQDTMPLDWKLSDCHAGIVELYRDLIRLRLNRTEVTRGLCGHGVNVHHVNDGAKVIAYHRWDSGGAGDDVIVIANFSCRIWDWYRIGFPHYGQWKVRLNSDWNGYCADFGNTPGYDVWANAGWHDDLPFWGDISIGPYSLLILSQDEIGIA